MILEYDPFGLSLEDLLAGLEFRCDDEVPRMSARVPSEDSFDQDYTIFKELRELEVAQEAKRLADLEAQKELDRLAEIKAMR